MAIDSTRQADRVQRAIHDRVALSECIGDIFLSRYPLDNGNFSRFEGVSESGYSRTQSVVLAFMDGSDFGMETERIDSEYQ